ncbi:hypothetical protein MASR2M15_12030 [Anaerolineales bacterium]
MIIVINSDEVIDLISPYVHEFDAEFPINLALNSLISTELITIFRLIERSKEDSDAKMVHHLRVAVRRIRSFLREFIEFLPLTETIKLSKLLKTFSDQLSLVRAIDVLLLDLKNFQDSLENPDEIASIFNKLHEKREAEFANFRLYCESKAIPKLLKRSLKFLIINQSFDRDLTLPHQTRHVLPMVISHRLYHILAYDVHLADLPDAAYHELRMEFKQFRYILNAFSPILGKTAISFIDEIKVSQDTLGHFHDLLMFSKTLSAVKLSKKERKTLKSLLKSLKLESKELKEQFIKVNWPHFNSRIVQKKLSDALLVLR